MNADSYLTVKEFAEAAGITTQRVYKLSVATLQPYVKKQKNGYTLIKAEALELFGKASVLQPCNDDVLQPCNTEQSPNNAQSVDISTAEPQEQQQGSVATLQQSSVGNLQPSGDSCNQSSVDSRQQSDDLTASQIVDILRQQLSEKDRLITTIQDDARQQLTAKDTEIARLHDEIAALTESLKAAQSLHAGTIQSQLTVSGTQSDAQASAQTSGNTPTASAQSGAADTDGDQAEEKPPSLWDKTIGRLFKKK